MAEQEEGKKLGWFMAGAILGALACIFLALGARQFSRIQV